MKDVRKRLPGPSVWFAAVLCTILGWSALDGPSLRAQPKDRRNRLIEALENGRTAITGDTWAFVDREHRPYDVTELRATLTKMFANKNAQGQPALAPIVRIPAEGDQDVRWIIKQVLESGAMGIIVPHGRERRAGAEGHPVDALSAAQDLEVSEPAGQARVRMFRRRRMGIAEPCGLRGARRRVAAQSGWGAHRVSDDREPGRGQEHQRHPRRSRVSAASSSVRPI